MKNKVIIVLFTLLILAGCNKENPKPKMVIFIPVDPIDQQI